jgi:hypothetical protein
LTHDLPILVTAMPSAGSTSVAAMLSALGVDMGRCRSAQDSLENNQGRKYRTFECRELFDRIYEVDEQRCSPGQLADIFKTYLEKRRQEARGRPYGVKNVTILHLAPYQLIKEIPGRWVIVQRDLNAVFKSSMKYWGRLDRRRGMFMGRVWVEVQMLREKVAPVLDLWHEEVLLNPGVVADRMCDALGLEPTAGQRRAAIEAVQPGIGLQRNPDLHEVVPDKESSFSSAPAVGEPAAGVSR